MIRSPRLLLQGGPRLLNRGGFQADATLGLGFKLVPHLVDNAFRHPGMLASRHVGGLGGLLRCGGSIRFRWLGHFPATLLRLPSVLPAEKLVYLGLGEHAPEVLDGPDALFIVGDPEDLVQIRAKHRLHAPVVSVALEEGPTSEAAGDISLGTREGVQGL